MHARQLIEIAGLASLHAGPLLQSGGELCSEALSEYWIASRCRVDHWGRTLRSLGHSRACPPADEAGDLLVRLSEELMLSEVLTRVVAAVCLASDHRSGQADDVAPIGANTLDAHREAISRLHALTFAWWSVDSPRARHARSLRGLAEHWTDALLAYVASPDALSHLAHDPTRLIEFAYDSRQHGAGSSRGASQLLAYALRTGFVSATAEPLCPELNRRVAGAAAALFGPAGFDGVGLMRPAWALRAERTTEETLALVERFFADEEAPITAAGRLPARWRI